MFQILRIVFCILACICTTAGFFIGAYFGFGYAMIAFAAAIVFALMMFFVKDGNPFHREKEVPKTDFMNSDEENAKIRKEQENTKQ